METALGTLQNQSTWLTGQLNSLPSWSSSKS
jgi:flagellar hook-associated protein 2